MKFVCAALLILAFLTLTCEKTKVTEEKKATDEQKVTEDVRDTVDCTARDTCNMVTNYMDDSLSTKSVKTNNDKKFKFKNKTDFVVIYKVENWDSLFTDSEGYETITENGVNYLIIELKKNKPSKNFTTRITASGQSPYVVEVTSPGFAGFRASPQIIVVPGGISPEDS
jgi:hypothetical protein